MNLIDALLGEHGVFYALFARLEESLPKAETLSEVQGATAMLTTSLVSHAKIENEVLFPALEAHLGPEGPLAVMRREHEEIESTLQDVESMDHKEEAVVKVLHALQVARDHFAKEEQVLFPLARRTLPDASLIELGERWTHVRRVVVA